MSASDWTMQFLADMLDAQVDRPTIRETTALGVASLAGWQAGIYPSPDRSSGIWRLDRTFKSSMANDDRSRRYLGWRDAVARTVLAP
jgi:glycerol kinase